MGGVMNMVQSGIKLFNQISEAVKPIVDFIKSGIDAYKNASKSFDQVSAILKGKDEETQKIDDGAEKANKNVKYVDKFVDELRNAPPQAKAKADEGISFDLETGVYEKSENAAPDKQKNEYSALYKPKGDKVESKPAPAIQDEGPVVHYN